MVNPWDVQRATDFVPCACHVLVDSHPGLLLGERDGMAFVAWAPVPGEMCQAWIEAGRVQQLDQDEKNPAH